MHWPPKKDDPVYDQSRVDRGRNPYGKIVRVFHPDEEVFVHFRGESVEWDIHGVVDFNNQAVCRLKLIRIDGILHHGSIAYENPERLLPGGDQVSYTFEDLDGHWDSSDGGEGCWILEEQED